MCTLYVQMHTYAYLLMSVYTIMCRCIYIKGTSKWTGALGTFTCKSDNCLRKDIECLEADHCWSKFLPWGAQAQILLPKKQQNL
jgi:hypothetical protein